MSFTSEIQTIDNPTQSRNRVRVIKLLLMGPANAGKTVFGKKLEEAFNGIKKKGKSNFASNYGSYLPTPGIDFYRVMPEDTQSYLLWELGGQAHYQPLWSIWWHGAKGAFVVIDSVLAMTESYLTKVREIIKLIQDTLFLPFVVCLNKLDLSKCNKTVLKNLSQQLGVAEEKIIPICAITGLNVRNALYYLLEII